jgi:hypothetical protein
MVVGAVALVILMRRAPPADSPAASPAPPETAALPEQPRRSVDVGEELVTVEPATREPPPPARAAVPSEVVEQRREAAPSIPAPPDWAADFAAESIDREWAPRGETEILSRFAEQPGLQLLAVQVECRTTLCEVQMTQPSSAAREPPMALLNTSGMRLLSVNTRGSQPSMQITVAILSRPGHEPFPLRQLAADPPESASEARPQ